MRIFSYAKKRLVYNKRYNTNKNLYKGNRSYLQQSLIRRFCSSYYYRGCTLKGINFGTLVRPGRNKRNYNVQYCKDSSHKRDTHTRR